MLLSLRNKCEQQNRSALRYYFAQEYLAGSMEKREREMGPSRFGV